MNRCLITYIAYFLLGFTFQGVLPSMIWWYLSDSEVDTIKDCYSVNPFLNLASFFRNHILKSTCYVQIPLLSFAEKSGLPSGRLQEERISPPEKWRKSPGASALGHKLNDLDPPPATCWATGTLLIRCWEVPSEKACSRELAISCGSALEYFVLPYSDVFCPFWSPRNVGGMQIPWSGPVHQSERSAVTAHLLCASPIHPVIWHLHSSAVITDPALQQLSV